MNKLQQFGSLASFILGLIYIAAFIYFGAILEHPGTETKAQLQFLADHQVDLSLANLLMYVLFGIVLAVLVQCLHEELKIHRPLLVQLASLFGYLWVALVIVAGMIANISLATVIETATTAPEQAKTIWLATDVVIEGIGGGNELIGGLWVLLVSHVALKSSLFSKRLNILGLLVGMAGIATIYPATLLTEIFGLSQILWFFWLSFALAKRSTATSKNANAPEIRST